MKRITQTCFLLAWTVCAIFTCVSSAAAQPSGGTVTGPAPSTAPTTKPAAKATSKTGNKSTPRKSTSPRSANNRNDDDSASAGPSSTINGKWWTTGNGFGDSEVIFTQNGSQVSGMIRYADGRTGSLTGQMIGKRLQYSWQNSSGDGGTGWLEHSWNNFLGGPWRSTRVRDGSWTLTRFEGKWCFGGSRNRIRTLKHNARGEVLLVTEDGWRDEGLLKGPWIFLHGEFGDIKGDVSFKTNRVNWNTGFFWTWCGS